MFKTPDPKNFIRYTSLLCICYFFMFFFSFHLAICLVYFFPRDQTGMLYQWVTTNHTPFLVFTCLRNMACKKNPIKNFFSYRQAQKICGMLHETTIFFFPALDYTALCHHKILDWWLLDVVES